jgi:hypothetical protein
MSSLAKLRQRVVAFAQRQQGRRWVKVVRGSFVIGIVAWLAYSLSSIGWGDVWAARPRTPWFYVIWLALFVQLPLIESLIYGTMWGVSPRASLSPLARKRVLNQDVVSYAGEAYFFAWARQRLDLPDGFLLGTLKDNAVASSLASWVAALLLVGGCLLTGQIVLADLVGQYDPVQVAAGVGLVVGLATLALLFRRMLFTLPTRGVLALLGTHLVRYLVIGYTLQILQWWVVLPDTPLSVWATMLAVLTLINRVPFIPARDLVGIGAVLGMTDVLAASEATIAAMLLTRSALDKLCNVALFGGLYLFDPTSRAVVRQTEPSPDPGSDEREMPSQKSANAPVAPGKVREPSAAPPSRCRTQSTDEANEWR